MDDRLPTGLWVAALIRRAEIEGAFPMVIARGDDARGDVLVKVIAGVSEARGFVGARSMEGERVFEDLRLRGVDGTNADIDAYIDRARGRDPDLWVIEVDDKELRHFLTEPVRSPEDTG